MRHFPCWRTLAAVVICFLALCGATGTANAACTVSNPPPNSTATRLDTMTADAVKLTGGCIDNIPIGQNTAAAATLTTLGLKGATSGTLAVIAPPVAGTNTITLPAGTTDFSATGGAGQVVKQASVGGAFTVGQLSASDISGGCSAPTDSYVMFGSSGCAGSANLTWNNTNQILAITGSTGGAGHNYALSVSGGASDGTHIAAKFGDTSATLSQHYVSLGYDSANERGMVSAWNDASATTTALMLNNGTGFGTVYAGCSSAWLGGNPGGIVGCVPAIGGGGSGGNMLTGVSGGGNRFLAAADGSSNGYMGLSRGLDGAGAYHTLLHSSGLSYFNGGAVVVGGTSLTGATGELGILVNTTDPNSAPGATDLKLTVVCGTNAGSAKLVARAGTSATPVTVLDNIGSGVSGC